MLGTLCTLITLISCSAPQFVLRFRDSWSSPLYGSGFSSSRFTSTAQSSIDYQLIITN
ncbi:hypothetical protein JZ751_021596, partial [Albula glossodonta]